MHRVKWTLIEVQESTPIQPTHCKPLTCTSSPSLRAPLSPGPAAAGLSKEAPLPAPDRGRQAGIVDIQPATGRGSWCLGRKAAVPPVQARPLSRFHFFHSLGPQPRLSGALPAVEFPQRCPPPGRGGGGEQAQAGVGGNSPPHPPEPDSSDLPVLPQGLGGGQRRCVGGRGWGPRERDGGGVGVGGALCSPTLFKPLAHQTSLPTLGLVCLGSRLTWPSSDNPRLSPSNSGPEADREARFTGRLKPAWQKSTISCGNLAAV